MVRLGSQLLPVSSLPIFSVNMGKGGKAEVWGSVGGGPLFPRIACNELGQPLMGSLNRRNRSPSWQSGQAGCLTHYESLIRAWAQASAAGIGPVHDANVAFGSRSL